MKLSRATIMLSLVLAVTAVAAPVAQGAPVFQYQVSIDDGAWELPAGGDLKIFRLDDTKTTRIIVSPPSGSNRYDTGTIPAGVTSHISPKIVNLSGGDTIHVRQPATSVAATESFVIPPVDFNVTVGANVITGNTPPGVIGAIQGEYRCNDQPVPHRLPAGSFSIPSTKILPGEKVQVNASTLDGDELYFVRHAPGESPCVEINARVPAPPVTGDPPNAKPYDLNVDNLNAEIAASVRVVLRRGTTILHDTSADALSIGVDIASQPLPGDVVDIYRPKTALTPMHSRTVPSVTAVFDASADLVAVDAPAAAQLMVGPCRAYDCPMENIRAQRDAPAGRTLFDFKLAQGIFGPADIRPDDRVGVSYNDPDNVISYSFTASPGDLVAPQQSIKLASNLKRKTITKAFKKGYKVNVKSNEPGSVALTLAFPKSKAGKAVTLAKASRAIVAGTTAVKLKFTKAGKKAIGKLRKRNSRLATLTSTVTDASGNVSTLVKRTKIKA